MFEDWSRVGVIVDKARQCGVSVNLHYVECSDSYYWDVDSVAPAERWMGKDYSFDCACDCVVLWLDRLLHLIQENTNAKSS